MRRRLLAAALLAGTLVLSACSQISAGYITGKDHNPGFYMAVTYCAMYNTKGACTAWAVRQDWVPPTWRFDLREQTDGLNGAEPKDGWAYVDETTFNEYEVGDYFEKEG